MCVHNPLLAPSEYMFGIVTSPLTHASPILSFGQSFADVEVTDDGVQTALFLKASDDFVNMFGGSRFFFVSPGNCKTRVIGQSEDFEEVSSAGATDMFGHTHSLTPSSAPFHEQTSWGPVFSALSRRI